MCGERTFELMAGNKTKNLMELFKYYIKFNNFLLLLYLEKKSFHKPCTWCSVFVTPFRNFTISSSWSSHSFLSSYLSHLRGSVV